MPSNPNQAQPRPQTNIGATGTPSLPSSVGATPNLPANGAPGTPSQPLLSSNPNQNIQNTKENAAKVQELNKQGEAAGSLAAEKTLQEVVVSDNPKAFKNLIKPSRASMRLAKLQIDYPYPSAPLGKFFQEALKKIVAYSKDIRKQIILGTNKVEAANEVDLCNLISYFLTQALPSGSAVEKQFQQVKDKAAEALEKIEESESKIINFPLKQSSIPSGSQVYTTNVNNNQPRPSNISAQNSGYGGGGVFNTPPTSSIQSTTGGNSGTSAESQPGNPLTVDDTLQAIRTVKATIDSLNIPAPVLKVIPGGGKILDSLKRINQQIPTNISEAPNQDLQNILKSYNDLKQLLSGISTASNPLDLLSALQAQNSIARLQDRLNPVQLIPIIKQIIRAVEALSRGINAITQFLTKINYVIRVLNTIIKIVKAIVKFIENLPIPARWMTSGTISKLESTKNDTKDKIKQITQIISNASYFISTTTVAFATINQSLLVLVNELRTLVNNLEACDKTVNLPATKQLKQAIITLEKDLVQYTNQLPKKPTKTQTIYKGFILDIVEEQVTDEGIELTRRYGVALDNRGVVVVQTSLTYATNLELIKNELRYLIDKSGANANPNADNTISEEDQIYADLDLPNEQEQLAELAATQAQIDDLVKQIQPEENLRQERSKKDKRKFRRFKRTINRLKRQGLTKEQIKNKVLKKNRFDRFSEQDFEEAYRGSTVVSKTKPSTGT